MHGSSPLRRGVELRQKEFGRGGDREGPEEANDHFPKVDAASQQARLASWTKTLATLDGIPFDQGFTVPRGSVIGRDVTIEP